MRFVVTLLIGLLGGSALAACPEPYTGTKLAADLSQLGTSLRDQDMAKFIPSGVRVEAGLACADKLFPRMAYASAYRYVGVAKFRGFWRMRWNMRTMAPSMSSCGLTNSQAPPVFSLS